MPSVLPLILVLLLSVSLSRAQDQTLAENQDTYCPFDLRETSCLPSFATSPHLYSACLDTPCYLFLPEPPFIILPESPPEPPYTPFPCSEPHPYRGITFSIHANLPDALCIYAGPDCTFNDLIHFTAINSNYSFAITGILIHTPARMCFHTPAASVVEDSMVIIGNAETGRRVDNLIRPFSTLTWVVVALCCLLILVVAFCIAFESRGKPSFVTAFLVAAGDSSSLLRKKHTEEHKFQLSRYTLSISLLKIAVAALITMLALFYEAGVVNFLFQQNTAGLGKRIKNLSPDELRVYSVLKDSALEQVWNATVNPKGHLYDPTTEQPPWKRCERSEQCIEWVADKDNEVMFDVTFGITARYLIPQVSSCAKLSIFATKDILYHFTAGMLFTENEPSQTRKEVSRRLIGMRIDGTLGKIIDEPLDESICQESLVDPQLGPLIVLVPLCIAVFPPLILSILIIFCVSHKKKPAATSGSAPSDSNEKTHAPLPTESVEISAVSSGDTMQRGSTVELDEITLS